MGLANLVPGISGGTMLLAAGVYPQFIEGIAEVTTLRFRARNLALLGAIGGAAAIGIVSLAGLIKGLVIDHRWAMFSLFIGLTLGGVPVVWRLLRPATISAVAGCLGGIVLMAVMVVVQPGAQGAASGGPAYGMLFGAGLAGASAMILPGISGGYLLLIMGQYLTILGAIDQGKVAVGAGPDWPKLTEAMHVFVPVGIGVVLGIVLISNLVKILLAKYEKATLGTLLGLLLGAVFGLWPFQQGVAPGLGTVIKGREMTAALIAQLDPRDYPLEFFSPSGGQIAGAISLLAFGFAITQAVAWVGRSKEETN